MEHLAGQYFLNTDLREDEIREQIGMLCKAGYEEVFLHARAGLETPYLSRDWFDALQVAIDERLAEIFKRQGIGKRIGIEAIPLAFARAARHFQGTQLFQERLTGHKAAQGRKHTVSHSPQHSNRRPTRTICSSRTSTSAIIGGKNKP